MTEINLKHKRHLAACIAFGFISPFIFLTLGFIFFPPDMKGLMPIYSDGMIYLNEIAVAAFIFGCALMGIKLADDRKVMPAAGFTMMAIAQGVSYATIFEAFGMEHKQVADLLEMREKAGNISAGGAILFIPALILITTYSLFPRWLNWAGIIISFPFIASSIAFMLGVRNYHFLEIIGNIDYMLFNLLQIFWGVWVWKRRYD